MHLLLGLLLAGILGMASPSAAQGPGVKLLVSPQTVTFRNPGTGMVMVSQPDMALQVVALGNRSWRLTVTALGPLVNEEGSRIPTQQVTWQARPAPEFLNGTLSEGLPRLLAQGRGSKAGVVRFIVKNRWEYPEGLYNQRLMFNLSSP